MSGIGVFDSGVGGLSVLRALRGALPQADFHYLADQAWAPYGEREPAALQARTLRCVHWLRERCDIDTLVVACNSATAVAIDALRQAHPDLPIVGIEPALRPALLGTRSGQVGVVATRATLQSPRYAALRERCLREVGGAAHLVEQACDGLADAIERGQAQQVRDLCREHLGQLRRHAPALDTLVLACTHYPLAADTWTREAGAPLTLVDPAEAVARRTQDVHAPARNSGTSSTHGSATVHLWSTAPERGLEKAARHWLGLPGPTGHCRLG